MFSAKISIPSSSMNVSYIIFSIILKLFGDLLIIKLPIILFHPVLLALPLFTSRYPPCNIFFSSHSVSYTLSIYGTNHTLIQKAERTS
jgi:hypothetical protein